MQSIILQQIKIWVSKVFQVSNMSVVYHRDATIMNTIYISVISLGNFWDLLSFT